jgi:hypothetical protein
VQQLCSLIDFAEVVSSNSAHDEVYSIKHYVIKFVSDLGQVCGFLWVLQFPWKELVCWKYVFCWGSLDGICISCEVPSIADTTLGISEQYIFFCHRTGMVGHWIHITFCAQIKLLTSINSNNCAKFEVNWPRGSQFTVRHTKNRLQFDK